MTEISSTLDWTRSGRDKNCRSAAWAVKLAMRNLWWSHSSYSSNGERCHAGVMLAIDPLFHCSDKLLPAGGFVGFVCWFLFPSAFFGRENSFCPFWVWKFLAFDPCLHMEQFRVSSWVRKGSKQGISEGWLWRASLQTFLKDTEKLFLLCLVWSHHSQWRWALLLEPRIRWGAVR